MTTNPPKSEVMTILLLAYGIDELDGSLFLDVQKPDGQGGRLKMVLDSDGVNYEFFDCVDKPDGSLVALAVIYPWKGILTETGGLRIDAGDVEAALNFITFLKGARAATSAEGFEA